MDGWKDKTCTYGRKSERASLCHDLKLKDTSTVRGVEMFLLVCRHLQTMTQHSNHGDQMCAVYVAGCIYCLKIRKSLSPFTFSLEFGIYLQFID